MTINPSPIYILVGAKLYAESEFEVKILISSVSILRRWISKFFTTEIVRSFYVCAVKITSIRSLDGALRKFAENLSFRSLATKREI